MKGINLIIAILLTIGISLETSTATAEKRVKIFEMAESGQIVEFPMNPKEIAAEDAERARLAALRKAASNSPGKAAKSFGLAESGIIIAFPLPQPEMLAENR